MDGVNSLMAAGNALFRGVGYLGLGGLIACAGSVCGANPVALEVGKWVAKNFWPSQQKEAELLGIKLCGLAFTAAFSYYGMSRCESKEDKIALFAGAFFASLLDSGFYVMACLAERSAGPIKESS